MIQSAGLVPQPSEPPPARLAVILPPRPIPEPTPLPDPFDPVPAVAIALGLAACAMLLWRLRRSLDRQIPTLPPVPATSPSTGPESHDLPLGVTRPSALDWLRNRLATGPLATDALALSSPELLAYLDRESPLSVQQRQVLIRFLLGADRERFGPGTQQGLHLPDDERDLLNLIATPPSAPAS